MKHLLCALIVTFVAFSVKAQGLDNVSGVKLSRSGNFVQLSMDIDIAKQKPPRNSLVLYTPRLVGEHDSIDFPEVVIFGRSTYYYNVRGGESELFKPDAYKIRHKGGPRREHYARTIAHQPWMENSRLKIIRSDGTPCDGDVMERDGVLVVDMTAFTLLPPDTTLIPHENKEQEELAGSVSGQARIRFIVNRTEFVPELANNRRELRSMHNSILEVQADKRVQITKYRIKGYASPEGSWDNNVRLAQGRTERLREFMVGQWGVPQNQIEIDYEPEDWKGFREYLVAHRDEYPQADAILDIIDSDMAPDPKLAKISSQYPAAYKRLLADCFPALRRTDYNIDYDWIDVIERRGKTTYDTIITQRSPKTDDLLEEDVFILLRPSRPWLALKTNLLFDLALTPNVEIEAQLGRDSRWSIMVEDWFPWFLHSNNGRGEIGTYKKPGNWMYKYAYELWAIGAELRYWMRPRCPEARPWLTGTFLGAYCATGKYDWEWDSNGDQGEFISTGLSFGWAWPLARHWNMELSVSAGAVWGPRRHYHGEFDDTHLIWKYTDNLFYIGPTKLKLSIAWLIPSLRRQKGGAQ